MSIKSYKKLQFSQVLADFVHSFQISTFNIPLLPTLYIEPYTYYYVDPIKKLCEIKFNDKNQAMEHFTTQHLAKKELLIVQDYANQHTIQSAIDKIENRPFCYRTFSYGNRSVWSLYQYLSYMDAADASSIKLKSIHFYTESYKKGAIICCNIELVNNTYKLQICEKSYHGEISDLDPNIKHILRNQIQQFIEAIYTTIDELMSVKILSSCVLFHYDTSQTLWIYDIENLIVEKCDVKEPMEFMLTDKPVTPYELPPIPKISFHNKVKSSMEALGIKNSTVINVDRYRYQRKKLNAFSHKISPSKAVHKVAAPTHRNPRSQSTNLFSLTPISKINSTVLVPLKSIINFEQMQQIKKAYETRFSLHNKNIYSYTRPDSQLIAPGEKFEVNGEKMLKEGSKSQYAMNGKIQINDIGVSTNDYSAFAMKPRKSQELMHEPITNLTLMRQTKMSVGLQKTYFRFSTTLIRNTLQKP